MLRSAFVAFVTLIAVSTAADAQPLADRVRSDALIYFGWSGAASMGPGYEKSYLKAVVDSSNMRQVIDDFLPRVFQRIAQETAEVEPVRQIMYEVVGPMWSHPTAFYFGGVEFKGKEQPPMPKAALLCRAGPDAPGMLKKLKELTAQATKEVPLRAAQVGDLVVVSIGFESAELAVAGGKSGAKSIAQDEAYRGMLANVHKESLAALYVDFAGVLKQIDKAVETFADPEFVQNWPKVRDICGLAGIKRLIATEAFEGQEWGSRAFVDAPAPRKGLLTVLESKPISKEALQSIPATSTIAGVVRFDFSRLVSVVRKSIGEFDADAGKQVDDAMGDVKQMIGLDVEADILAPLGDEWAYYMDPMSGGKGILGFTVVNRLRDPKKAEESFDQLGQVLNAVAADFLQNKPVKVAIKEATVKGVKIRYIAVPLLSPAWAVADGNLYIGLFPQTVATAVEHVKTNAASIEQNESFAALRKQLGGGEKITSVQWIDLPKTAPDAYPGWMMIGRSVGFGDLFGVDSPAIVGPPFKTLMANLKPTLTVMWADEKGMYSHSRVPFPGASMLSSDPFGGNPASTLLQAIAVLGEMK
jgi:hypothetical protein